MVTQKEAKEFRENKIKNGLYPEYEKSGSAWHFTGSYTEIKGNIIKQSDNYIITDAGKRYQIK